MFIELHLLQNFAPSNLNRDDTNNPKDCVFGGVRRARISSQCVKRAIRLHPVFEKTTGVSAAERTRFLARAVADKLVEAGKTDEEARKAASNVVGEILGGIDPKKETRSKVLFFTSAEEKDYLTRLVFENWDQAHSGNLSEKPLADSIKEFKKKFSERTSAPGIALFGRMLAEDPVLNMDASCQVAHAISTHRVNMEFDFFTAVDDLQTQEETGAGMMGIVGYNAATFYRYTRLDFDQLLTNLGKDLSLARKTVEGFLRASVFAIPTGKQNSFAAQNPPSFLMAVIRDDGMAWSLANAFEKPVYPKGDRSLLETSVEALDGYWGSLVDFFGHKDAEPVVGFIGIQPELKTLKGKVVDNFDGWLENVLKKLPEE